MAVSHMLMNTRVSQGVGWTHYQVHWFQIAAVRAQKTLQRTKKHRVIILMSQTTLSLITPRAHARRG